LEQDTAKVKIREEADGRIRQQRENLDVQIRLDTAAAKETRTTRLQIIDQTFKHVSNLSGRIGLFYLPTLAMIYILFIGDALTDPTKLGILVGGASALFLGFHASKVCYFFLLFLILFFFVRLF